MECQFKGDNVLFQMAQQVLTDADDERLHKQFERHERERIGEGIHEQCQCLVHGLEAEFVAE